MNLISAFQAARSSLGLGSAMSAITSRNIAGAGDSAYSQKQLTTSFGSEGLRVLGVTRSVSDSIRRSYLEASSRDGAANEVARVYENLASALSINQPSASVAGKIGAFADAVQAASSQPSQTAPLAAVVEAAKDLAGSIVAAAGAIYDAYVEADETIRISVGRINTLLADFESVHSRLVREQGSGADVTDLLDRRDSILASLAEEIGISTVEGADGSMSIYASGGSVLFNRTRRDVSISTDLEAGGGGSRILIDGVNVSDSSAAMRVTSGRLAGAISVRDSILPQQGRQLDALAVGLVQAFSESTAGSGDLANLPGLFVLAEGGGSQSAPAWTAGRMTINRNVDPSLGGNVFLVRDGGISNTGNPDYVANTSGAASYSERLQAYISILGSPQAFDGAAGLPGEVSIHDYSINLLTFVAQRRQSTQASVDQTRANLEQLGAALSSATGVNLDDEMSRLLQIENSYKATTKLISVVDGLYDSLFAAIR